ncbi:stage II sporulation protein D [Anaerovirgula multivorans]|uniref:Stage II sporulation protein D n=1 Tax=Anaerovirgula multivorans TaxID=312168 RepID=A0A239DQR7_9FIRM|nr:SpoIID/LytB domain-containing protein [Anaerovirgula multivorans]SNS34073.1 stage II sporulation protein D [Anaerovirgula multivorans]
MKRSRQMILILLTIITVMLGHELAFAFNKSQIPMNIEIGLFFQGAAKSTVLLKSNNGFEVGEFLQDEFIPLLDLSDKKDIILRKDSFYIGSGGNYVEYTGAIIENQTNIQGPYHVQIGGLFNNRNEATQLIQFLSLGTMEEQPYLVYENGWKVFIGLYVQQEIAQIKANEINDYTGQATTVIPPSITRVQILDLSGRPLFMFDSTENVYFRGVDNKGAVSVVSVEGKNYRGAITAKRLSNSDMSIVNKLPLEEYLYGVVPSEMPALWSLEALKAQAVAVRGYAIANMNRFRNVGFDLCSTTTSQAYGGFDREHPNSNRAVDETHSKVLTYNGELVNAFYHSNSGGYTENSENVWSSTVAYIRGVKDDFSLGHQNSTWTEVLTKSQVKTLLENNNVFVGEVIDLKVTSVSQNGRVLELTVFGTNGQEVFVKERSRTIFGLKSTWFTVNGTGGSAGNSNDIMIRNNTSETNPITLNNKYIISSSGVSQISNPSNIKIYNGTNYRETIQSSTVASDSFVFDGKGFGHGLGMSQWGAKKMAEEGYNYVQILTHYYTGTKVE